MRRHSSRAARRSTGRGLVLALATVLIVSGCGSGGSSESSGKDAGGKRGNRTVVVPPGSYEVKNGALIHSPVVRQALDTGKLVIGVKDDQPGMGFQDPKTKVYSGFDIEIAKMVAADLGFRERQISFKTIASADREGAITSGSVDLYIGTYTINDQRKKLVDFAGPYFQSGQDLLVLKTEKKISGPEQLKGRKVCAAKGSTALEHIADRRYGARTVSYEKYSQCVEQLMNRRIDAVSTDGSILLGYAAQPKYAGRIKVVGNQFSREPYGVGLAKDDGVLREAVNRSIEAHQKNGDWEAAFRTHLGKAGADVPTPPTVERY